MAGKSSGPSFAGVSVVAAGSSCAAAQALRNKRFLSREAPRLPLKDCDTPGQCQCVYKKHDDRGAKPRRASERGTPDKTVAVNKRLGRGHRETD